MSPLPSFATAVTLHRQLFFRRLRRRSTLWIATALCALPPLLAVCLTLFAAGGRNTFTESMELSLVLLPFLPLLFASSLIGEELERSTTDFVLTRPVPRATLLIGRLTALWPVATAAVMGVLLAFVASYATRVSDAPSQLPRLGAALLATASGFAAYAALAALASVLFPRHTVVALGGYIVAVEMGIAQLPVALHWLGLSWHLCSLVEVPKAASVGWAPTVPPWLSLLVVWAAGAVALLFAMRRLEQAEPRGES